MCGLLKRGSGVRMCGLLKKGSNIPICDHHCTEVRTDRVIGAW